MNIYEIKEVTNPDYAGYTERHICYVSAKNESSAYSKAKIKQSGYYPISKLSKRDKEFLLTKIKEDFMELNIILESYKCYSSKKNLNKRQVNRINLLINRSKRSLKFFKKKYKLVKISL